MSYVPLRLHTKFSPVLSLIDPVDLAGALAARGIRAGAVVDRGVLFGFVQARSAFDESDVAPIEGAEVEVAFPAGGSLSSERVYTLTLLCEDLRGRWNLDRLLRLIWSPGRIDRRRGIADLDEIGRYSRGLIALSGGMTGPVSGALVKGLIAEASRAAALLASLFTPSHFYLEVSRTNSRHESLVDPFLRKLERRFGLDRVAADPVRCLTKGDRPRLAELRAILPPGGGTHSPDPLVVEGAVHLPSCDEMEERYRDDPQPLDRTEEIAERCGGAANDRVHRATIASEGDELIRRCQSEIEKQYQGKPDWKMKEIGNRFWTEYWRYEDKGLLPAVQKISKAFALVRQIDRRARISTTYLSGSLLGYLTGLQSIDPEENKLSASTPTGQGRMRFVIDGDRKSVDNFRRVMSERYAESISHEIRPVFLSQADQERLDRIVRSSPGEWSGPTSNRSTQNLFEPHYRENQVPDPLLVNQTPPWSRDTIMTYQAEKESLIWCDSPESCWEMNAGLDLEIRASSMDEALRATDDLPEEDDGNSLLGKGNWAGILASARPVHRRLARMLAPRNREDIALLVAAGLDSKRGDLVRRIIKIRKGNAPIPLMGGGIEKILTVTDGVPFYREQVVEIIRRMTKVEHAKAEDLFNRMKCGEGPELRADRSFFVRRSVDRGVGDRFAEKVFSILCAVTPLVPERGIMLRLAGAIQTLSARKQGSLNGFAARILNRSLGDRRRLHLLVEGFQKEGTPFLPVDKNSSEYMFTEVDGGIRNGFAIVPGIDADLGNLITQERECGGPFRSVGEFLERMASRPFPRPALLRIAMAFDRAESSGRRSSGLKRASTARQREKRAGGEEGDRKPQRRDEQIPLPLLGFRSTGS